MSVNTENKPEISFVAVSRNDNHGGDLLGRMQPFVSGLLEQCRRHRIRAELLLVEWNPPTDRPKIAEALSWPETDGTCSVRIIEVPPDIHRRFKHSEKLPLFQMIGKNVGIRRARGDFILATNTDILFSDELMNFLGQRRLETGKLYRVDRYDVPQAIPLKSSISDRLDFCKNNIIRINSQEGTIILTGNADEDKTNKATKEKDLGYTLARLLEEKQFSDLMKLVYKILRSRYRAFRKILIPSGILHTNACGDFTLMAREHWMAARGYAEFEIFSMHIDSLLLYTAFFSGVNQTVLSHPMCIYHIEHSAGSGWQPGQGGKTMYKRLRETGIPFLKQKQLDRWERRMWLKRAPIIFNKNSSWGLAEEDLPETVINKI